MCDKLMTRKRICGSPVLTYSGVELSYKMAEMISRSNSRKSGNNSSGGGTLRERMQGDPFIRKRAVRYIAIIDQGISGLLLFYAAYRLVNYDFRDQSLILLIGANENIFIGMIYWLGVFALIGLQLVIAFLLLTATKDMTTDPETMIKKCNLWKSFSIFLLVFLSLDLVISLYTYLAIDGENQRLVSVALDAGESIFRLLGVFIIGKFITDLHSIFANPMTTLSASSSPVLQLRFSRTSSMNVSEVPSPDSAAVSRTQSMNASGDGMFNSMGGGGPLRHTMSVPRPHRVSSMSVDIVPKFSRTPSICTERPPLSRTLSVVTPNGSIGKGSRNEDGALVLNLDDGL